MYKKILVALIIGLSLLLLVKGTKAIFSDTSAIAGNSINTASEFPTNENQSESDVTNLYQDIEPLAPISSPVNQ